MAVQPVQVEIKVAGLHNDHIIKVGGDHLRLARAAHRLALQAGPAVEQTVNQAGLILRSLFHTDPIPDARQFFRPPVVVQVTA
ncbi:hypothetical protein [Trichlorobacter lovleyi]|uniref:hypothetical protein n=1 Tax=Trichlorobacter lovleyi TaxID=313985 RepID=UPI0024817ED5|nr:hypothetical protein [Trichlorobacter lovleyi]